MRRFALVATLLAVLASAVAAPSLARKGPPKQPKSAQKAQKAQNGDKKVWICHLAGKKYIAIHVSKKALPGHERHGDDVTAAAVPQTGRQAARDYCAGLQVLTPRRGGAERTGSLTNPQAAGVAAELDVRARLGQGEICFTLRLTGATGATSLVLAKGATTVATLTSLLDSGTTSTGCAPLSRELVTELLRTPGAFTATAVVTTASGPVTLTGSLAR